jgi:F1F0 ATPase subunit 2
MTMHDALPLAGAGLAGFLLGVFFYGGLWWTLRRGLASRRPALWLFASLFTRAGVALTGFYFTGGGHWQRLVAALLGFIVARLALTWLLPSLAREARHAP